MIGRAEVISNVSKKALTAYHRAAYASDNIVVAAAGNVTHDRLVELLGERARSALVTMERTAYDDSGSVVEHGQHVYRASRYRVETTLVER